MTVGSIRTLLLLAGLQAVVAGTILPPVGKDKLPRPAAKMQRVLPFKFEDCLNSWESGSPDESFIREETEEKWSGGEKCVCKYMYTKNPFPFIIRKTVLRGQEELVWYEEIRHNKRKRYATFWSINMSLQGVGLAYRRATMRADPSDGSKTIFLQEGGVELHGEYPRQFKSSIEHFAAQAFLGVCKRATDALEASLVKELRKGLIKSPADTVLSGVSEDEGADAAAATSLAGIIGSVVMAILHPRMLLSAAVMLRLKQAISENVAAQQAKQGGFQFRSMIQTPQRRSPPKEGKGQQQQHQQQEHGNSSRSSSRSSRQQQQEPAFKLKTVFGAAAAAFVSRTS